MRILTTTLLLLAGLLTACTAQTNNQNMNREKGKSIVVFFSHAGENYSVGNIKVGNTKRVADAISELTGAEQFEIVADKNYDMPYKALVNLATITHSPLLLPEKACQMRIEGAVSARTALAAVWRLRPAQPWRKLGCASRARRRRQPCRISSAVPAGRPPS